MSRNKTAIGSALVLAGACLIGCSQQTNPPDSSAPSSKAGSQSASPPAVQSAVTAWQQGDKPAAVSQFLKTDWSGQLFPSNSVLSLSEDQFKSLSTADREAKSGEMLAQIGSLKQLAAAVAQTGRDAAAGKDLDQARQHFNSLKQCGEALDKPASLALLKLVGQGIVKLANTELAKLNQ